MLIVRQFVPRPVFDIVPHGRLKSSHEVLAGSSKLFDNLVPLVDVVGSREEHPTPEHLHYHTALELDLQHCHLNIIIILLFIIFFINQIDLIISPIMQPTDQMSTFSL